MQSNHIKETIEQILEHLSISARFKGVEEMNNGEIVRFVVETEEPHLLIGENGKILMAFNHLVKKISEVHCARNNIEPMNFIVDVNNYQERRIQDIKNKAHIMAERARFFKSNVELIPMNPYERMIIHTLFSDSGDIETESIGNGRERRVVIKYIST